MTSNIFFNLGVFSQEFVLINIIFTCYPNCQQKLNLLLFSLNETLEIPFQTPTLAL